MSSQHELHCGNIANLGLEAPRILTLLQINEMNAP